MKDGRRMYDWPAAGYFLWGSIGQCTTKSTDKDGRTIVSTGVTGARLDPYLVQNKEHKSGV